MRAPPDARARLPSGRKGCRPAPPRRRITQSIAPVSSSRDDRSPAVGVTHCGKAAPPGGCLDWGGDPRAAGFTTVEEVFVFAGNSSARNLERVVLCREERARLGPII